jgi:polyhydroxybutyrate depolymerase
MVVKSFAPSRPVPIMHIHSVNDPRVLYTGGFRSWFPFLRRIMHPSVEEVIARWVDHNGCSSTPEIGAMYGGTAGEFDASHTATKIVYGACRDGAEVVLWKLTGAGHVWPGPGPKYPKWLLGAPTRVINASEELWQFFRRFSRPDAPRLATAE